VTVAGPACRVPATDGSPILLVEDDPDDVALIIRAFRRANLANPVKVARDGEEAVESLSGAGAHADRTSSPLPVLILLDLKVPRRNGHEVLEWMGTQDGLRRIPFAVLTSSGSAATSTGRTTWGPTRIWSSPSISRSSCGW